MSDQRTKKDRMPRRKLIIVTAIALAGFSLIALAASRPYWPVGHTVMTDSDRIERPESGAHIREVLWTPPVRMPDAFNTTGEDYEPKVSHDGSTLFFVRGKAGHNADIYMAGRDGLGWGEPVPVAGINSEYDDLGACLSRDGTALYFYSNRPGGFGGYDIWVAHRLLGRSDDAESPQFGEPVNLGPSVNSSLNDYGPSLTPDDRYLYFASNRPEEKADMPNPDAWQATVREDLYKNDYDLFTVLLTESGPQPAERAVLLNSEDDEGAPAISPVGDFLYFASNRDGGLGGFDLYRSRLIDGKPTSVTNLGDDVNTRHDELDPTLNMGGFGLFFSSNRVMLDAAPQVEQIASSIAKPEADRDSDSVINENGDSALQNLNEDQGAYQQEAKPPAQDDVQVSSESASKLDFDLFHTKSREVFRRVDYGRASFDWLGFWNDVGRWLLLALLALLLILLLLYLLQSVQGREMSLLARCLIASLLAHVVLMFLLALWQVTAGIPNGSNEGKGIIVSLAARDVSGGLAAQVTSKLTQVDMPSPVERQVEKSQAELSRPLESTMLAFEAPVATRATTLESAMPPPPPMEASQVPVSRTSAVPSIRVAEQPSQSVNAGATRLRLPETVMPSNQADPQPVTVNATLASDTTYERENVNAAPWQSTPLSETTLDHSRLAQATDADSLRRVQFDAPTLTDRAGRQSQQFAMPDMLAMQTDPTSEAALPDTAVSMPSADPRGESAETSANDENVVQPLNVMASRQAETNVGQHLMETLSDTQMEVALPELNINRSGGANSAVESTQLDVPAPEAVAVNRPDRSLPPLASPVQPSSDAALPMDIQMPDIQMSERATPEAGESEAQMADAAALDFPAPVAWEGADSAAHADSSVLPRLSANIPSLDASHLGSAMDAMRRQELAVEFSIPEPTLSLQEMMGLSLDLDDLNVPDQSTMDSLSLTEEAFRALPVAPERNAAFAQRAEEVREDRVEEGGGSEETERAVADALKWLAAHQSEDGSWDADLFDEECGQCGGESAAAVDRGITGLSLLCFLASNHTHVDAGPYQDTVARGLRFLRSGQSRNGDLRGEETMYSHAIATIALAEALAMSEDSSLRDPVERAISFIDRARNARDGGWRYDPGQAGDTSVLGWQVMALKSAGTAGLEVPWESLYAAKNWLDAVGTGRHGGLYQYMPGRGPSTSMTAEGLFVRKLLGETSNMPRRRESVERILDEVPTWSDEPNTYYWYYATLALFQEGGDSWKSWNAPMVQTLLTAQRRDGKAAGSWDPADRWSRVGGRVYQTAICTLTLQVYYRYLPGYAKPIPEDAIGRIEGVVRDSATGEPISDAMVRLDLADRENIRVSTDADGRFELYPPPLPDFFALSASAEGFLPDTVNVPRAMVMGKTLSRDFNLTRMENPIIALEADPRVHHLGDDDFSGRINSQFQRDAEGSRIEMNFELSESDIRASGLRRGDDDVTLTMMVKGVQLVHRLFVNDQLLDERLEDSPANGSFGEFTTTFPRSWLRLGENSFEIRASRRGNDVDDFEFVNVKIRLAEQP